MLRLSHVSRSFGATHAVDDVSLEVRSGEVLALVGENGAGKSTLMAIAAGELEPDAGTIERYGHVALVHQHFMLVPALTIAENLALADFTPRRLFTRRSLESQARSILASTGFDLGDVSRRVEELSVGEKSKLELIKAVARRPAVLILDEPTAVLTPHESEELFRVIRRLAAAGTAIVFISHKLPEVLAIAQRIVVMRAGKVVLETADATADTIAAAMVELPPARPDQQQRVLDGAPLTLAFDDLRVRRSEIVAIVGVAGNGQTELARRLRDALPAAGHIPEDRTRDGVVSAMTLAENLALRARRWKRRDALRHAATMMSLYAIRASGPEQHAGSLSGGNQQKLLLARELDRRPELIVAAEPTRGLDLASTHFVHEQLRTAARAGGAVLLITSDLDEAFALADTIHVIYRGRLSAPMSREEARTRVADLMAGVA